MPGCLAALNAVTGNDRPQLALQHVGDAAAQTAAACHPCHRRTPRNEKAMPLGGTARGRLRPAASRLLDRAAPAPHSSPMRANYRMQRLYVPDGLSAGSDVTATPEQS